MVTCLSPTARENIHWCGTHSKQKKGEQKWTFTHSVSVCEAHHTLNTWPAQTPPPSSPVIGLLKGRAVHWQIWIQWNREGRMEREGGGGERVRGRGTSLSRLSLFLSPCLSLLGQDGKAYTGRGGNMSWEVMTQLRRHTHILIDSSDRPTLPF